MQKVALFLLCLAVPIEPAATAQETQQEKPVESRAATNGTKATAFELRLKVTQPKTPGEGDAKK